MITIIKYYNYTCIILFMVFGNSLAIASSASVSVRPPSVAVWHSGLEWVAGGSKSASTNVTCSSGNNEAAFNASQTMKTYTHRYVKDFRTNSVGTPNGWNYSTTSATTDPPQYGIDCRKLQTNLKFYSGSLP